MAVELAKTTSRWLGASGDSKPTSAPIGSIFYEHDTGKHYTWAGGAWVQYANNVFVEDLDVDGVAYIDDMSVPNGFSMVSEVTAHSHFDHDNGAWDFFTKSAGAAELSRLRIPNGADIVDIAMANANLLFGHGLGIRANAANGTILDFEAYQAGAYVALANMYSSATLAFFSFGSSQQNKFYSSGRAELKSIVGFGAEADLTIATGAVTATQTYHSIIVQGGIGSGNDDLDTAAGGSEGDLLILKANTSGGSDTVTVKDGTGAGAFILAGGADFVMDHIDDRLMLISNGQEWVEISRSSNS